MLPWLSRLTGVPLIVASILLGSFQGARVAIGTGGLEEVAQEWSEPGSLYTDPIRGAFWTPAGSDAQRPRLETAQRRWFPTAPFELAAASVPPALP